jgi:hypothetical protein
VLEDQLCSFTSDFDRTRSGYSPDRLDALVWALTELMLDQVQRATYVGPLIGAFPIDTTPGYERVASPPKWCC